MDRNKFLEHKVRKYVIATLTSPTYYLSKNILSGKYSFVPVSGATKCNTLNMAQNMLSYYYSDTKDNIELVVVPVDITYELVYEDACIDRLN